MGRFNRQTGEFTAKPSVQKKVERMYGPTTFETALRYGTPVKVYMGAGWEKGAVEKWTKTRVTVRLARGNRTVIVHDARNLEIL